MQLQALPALPSRLSAPGGPALRPRILPEPNATLTARIAVTDTVARFRVEPDAAAPAFEPGQYLALGLSIDGRLVQRPYSTSSPRGAASELEFLIRRVPNGELTPRLWTLPVGSRLHLGRPKGLFTLLPDDGCTHLFIATGTGIAPFVSMVDALLRRARPPRVVVLHGASYADELAYREQFRRWQEDSCAIAYLPAVSRPSAAENAGWAGHAGRLDEVLSRVWDDARLRSAETIAYLCGNPAMISTGARILRELGLPEGAVRTEEYWPADTMG